MVYNTSFGVNMDYIELSELLTFLADLTLDAPDFETARDALALQTRVMDHYFPNRPQ